MIWALSPKTPFSRRRSRLFFTEVCLKVIVLYLLKLILLNLSVKSLEFPQKAKRISVFCSKDFIVDLFTKCFTAGISLILVQLFLYSIFSFNVLEITHLNKLWTKITKNAKRFSLCDFLLYNWVYRDLGDSIYNYKTCAWKKQYFIIIWMALTLCKYIELSVKFL